MRIDGVRYRKIGQTRVAGTLCDLLVPLNGRGPLRAEPVNSRDIVDGDKAAGDKAGAGAGASVGDKTGGCARVEHKVGDLVTIGAALATAVARHRWAIWLLAVLLVLALALGCAAGVP